LRRLADVEHQPDRGGKRRGKQRDVVPGNAVERRLLGSRKDQEGERQHQRDQEIEILGVELGIADEEVQRELLIDAEQDGDRGGDHQCPAPGPPQASYPRDLGFLQIADTAVRVLELDPLWRRGRHAIGRS
jgi:hypothetical protein